MKAPMILAMLVSAAQLQAAETFDVVLANGRIIDPQTRRDEIGHVGIRDARIVALSSTALSGKVTVDVRGLVVAPGFIDLHAHGQHEPGQKFQVMDGVTTAIDAESGAMPLVPFYAALEGKSLINFGATASHRCARLAVIEKKSCGGHPAINPHARTMMKEARAEGRSSLTSAATPEEERAIAARLREAVAEGALGFGIGIEYTPGAGRSEIYEIFKTAADVGAPVFVHVRRRTPDAAAGVAIAVVEEVIATAVVTGAPLQIAHVHSTGLGDTPVLVDMISRAQARGLDITSEAYPYTAGSTTIGSEFFADGWQTRSNISYADLQWAATGERLTEQTFARYRAESPGGNVVVHMIPREAVDAAIAHPAISIASDGMAWQTSGEHPRGAGTFSRVLGRYVRETNQLDLITALAKMTIMPAQRLAGIAPQMAHKGRLQEGADADITVFDPRTIADNATFEKPMQYSTGVRHVLVAGTFVVREGALQKNVFPGRAVKGERGAQASRAAGASR